jgi:UDP-GlcNAc:undecaprenyl-phosphate GlcNAc-1-phosphate transferase
MFSLIFLAILSFTISFCLTPLVSSVSRHFGVVDRPDNVRKFHRAPVPRLGGIGIFAAVVISYTGAIAGYLRGGGVTWSELPFAFHAVPAALLIFLTGLADDLFQLRAWHKLGCQVLASSLAFAAGVQIHSVAGHPVGTPLSFAITTAWLLACCNALNLIDGLDGLATGVGLFATVAMLAAALLNHEFDLALAATPLAAALVGFLRYNFNPASIFLGDCGSLTIGFLLGCYGILWSAKAVTFHGMSAPLIALAVPLSDVALSVARRFLRGQPIFGADRSHIHHQLLSRGLTPREVTLVLYATCGIGAIAAILISAGRERYQALVIGAVCFAASLGWRHLGYVEFSAARKLLGIGVFRGLLNVQLTFDNFANDLSGARNVEECWDVLRRWYQGLGFVGVIFCADGLKYTDRVSPRTLARTWQMRVQLEDASYVNLIGESRGGGPGPKAVSFADCISYLLAEKLAILRNRRLVSQPEELYTPVHALSSQCDGSRPPFDPEAPAPSSSRRSRRSRSSPVAAPRVATG